MEREGNRGGKGNEGRTGRVRLHQVPYSPLSKGGKMAGGEERGCGERERGGEGRGDGACDRAIVKRLKVIKS